MTFANVPAGSSLGVLPPIRLSETLHPRFDRRAVSLRWLGATVGLALVSAGMLTGVMHVALHRALKVRAAELAIIQPVPGVADGDGRADRLKPRRGVLVTAPSPIASQTLRSTGFGDRLLTMVVAQLAHLSSLSHAPSAPTPDLSTPPTEAHDRSPAPAVPLPSLIRFGATRVGAEVASYAAAEIPALAEPGPSGTALNMSIQAASPPDPLDRTSLLVAQRGDRLQPLLVPFALTAGEIADIGSALHLQVFEGGERLTVRQAAGATAGRRPLTVRLDRPDGSREIAALADDGHYRTVEGAEVEAGEAAPRTAPAGAADDGDADDASLRESLDALAGHGGIGPAIAANVVRVLGTDRDLGGAVSSGDRIQVLYEAAADDGSADQELDFAALTADGRTTRLYRYAAADDRSVDYYDEGGHSLTKFLLRKPVANGRLGDGFGWRTHPILGDRRFHEGVDYAAPEGSPIVAAGAGVIDKIDYESGYGKYIRVRHDLGYETTYAHVAGYPRGMAVGRRVQQGETIAFVGSTGLSTGPHLYYEVKINDRNVDPTRIKIAAGRILEGAALQDFLRQRDRIDVLLKTSRQTSG